MLVGIHVEGNDHLILRALLAKILECDEEALEVDHIDRPGMGWQAVLETAGKALRRFYAKCCALAVLGIDNDGDADLLSEGVGEDPQHPRHWLHASGPPNVACRYCGLSRLIAEVRPDLDWIPGKPGSTWPVVICVPVEAIESWLLIAQAIASPGRGSLHAENEPRSTQRRRFYGRSPTREDVRDLALPLLRALSGAQLQLLRAHSRSFDQFATQVLDCMGRLTGDCWS